MLGKQSMINTIIWFTFPRNNNLSFQIIRNKTVYLVVAFTCTLSLNASMMRTNIIILISQMRKLCLVKVTQLLKGSTLIWPQDWLTPKFILLSTMLYCFKNLQEVSEQAVFPKLIWGRKSNSRDYYFVEHILNILILC